MFFSLRSEATIGSSIKFEGIGVHSGRDVTMKISPSRDCFGIVFKRTDIFSKDPFVMLSPESVVNPTLCTRVTNKAGVCVVVVEHLLAALRICGITNALIELDSEEVPIMDGSAAVFVKELKKAKIIQQNSFVPAVVIRQPVVAKSKNGSISLTPNDNCEISVEISYDRINPVIGANNAYSFTFDNDDALDDIASSRTFGWFEDCEKVKNMGLALGASEENTIAILKDNSIKNEGGLRNPKELVMHKCLDLIGDISVWGSDIIGKISCVNPSHSLNNILIKTLANDFSCHQVVTSRNIGSTNGSAQIQKHMRQKTKTQSFFLPARAKASA